jgi:hypothetical protein
VNITHCNIQGSGLNRDFPLLCGFFKGEILVTGLFDLEKIDTK